VVDDQSYIEVHIREAPLSVDLATDFVADSRAGAITLFSGVTRSITGDRETVELSYEAYEPMARESLRQIAQEAFEAGDICRIHVQHRVGIVPAGDSSVTIAVSAPHRGDSFAACRYIIDQLKERTPIWKKELFSDGAQEWAQGNRPTEPL
jgi:molybdopterin synthase catalytic subunit